jgi:hypothetical protein
VAEGRVCTTSGRRNGAEGLGATGREHGGMGEGKGREERSVGLDGSGGGGSRGHQTGGAGRSGPQQGQQLHKADGSGRTLQHAAGDLHMCHERGKDAPRDGTSEMCHAGLEGGAQDEGLVLQGEG